MAVRGSVGLGKTRHVLEQLVRPELAGKHVAVFVPDHRLSEEYVERFNDLAGPGSPRARVVYGREQITPDGDYSRTGVNAIIMPGKRTGAYSVVGAGVVLYEDLPDREMVTVRQELERRPWGPEQYGW